MDRSHPLLDRLEATHSPPPLRDTALALLRLHWQAVRDVGDAPFALLKTLLPLSSAAQLADLELASPHLVPHTNSIWRQLCVNEFIEIRKAVEDGHISPRDEPTSWKEQYRLEEVKRAEKMQAIVSKMRGQINDYKTGRATTKEVDWRLEKRRKAASTAPARPKTLMEKARQNSKQIKSIYAPRRRPTPPAAAAALASSPPPPGTTPNGLGQKVKRSGPPVSPFLFSPRKRTRETSGSDSAAAMTTTTTGPAKRIKTAASSAAILVTTTTTTMTAKTATPATKRTLPVAAAATAGPAVKGKAPGPNANESLFHAAGTGTDGQGGSARQRSTTIVVPSHGASSPPSRPPPPARLQPSGSEARPPVSHPAPMSAPPLSTRPVIPRGIFMPKSSKR
ncbi:hypothetical protein JCM3774_002271 [Rhodotorula dairenensis]